MLYEKSHTEKLKEELFRNPTSEYRGTPFWAWNNAVSEEDTKRIIDALDAMGMGGAHIHCRTGMDLPYLGEEFFERVRYAHKLFNEKGMLTWLYDEDRWPSGAAGGIVTKDHALRSRFLVFSPWSPSEAGADEGYQGSTAGAVHSGEKVLLARYAVRLENGFLADYMRLEEGQEEIPPQYHLWYLSREINGDSAWFNDQAYVDTLNEKAIDRFLEVTHEAYKRELGDDFGRSVPAIFTDEPQFSTKQTLGFAEEEKEVTLPYTDDFCDTYRAMYHAEFLDTFPECIWDLPNHAPSLARYRYHDHVCERFAHSFADNIGNWCRRNGIALTGHMMNEPSLASQTSSLGEAMRSYRGFDLPGIDMLCDWRELTTAKQCASAVHQFGREGMLSEIYGVTGWDFDFRGHKLAGDWQAALGVTIRVHHLTWTSMAGEAKRDYPAAIGPQSPWFKEYKKVEDYFSRLNTVLTRGKSDIRIGVIHPVESYWLHWGPREQTAAIRQEMDENFSNLTNWLLFDLQDFDFISESLWPIQTAENAVGQAARSVGEMTYDCILVPDCQTLRSSTLRRLKGFAAAGGQVIFAGQIPSCVDAMPSDEVKQFAANCTCIGFQKNRILNALSPYRRVEIREADGSSSDNLITQIRQDGDRIWMFFAHVNKPVNRDIPRRGDMTIRIRGTYRVTIYDPMDGTSRAAKAAYENGCTVLYETMYDQDSLLLALDAGSTGDFEVSVASEGKKVWTISLPEVFDGIREEENVLVLDQAEYRFDWGEWQPKEDILRLDNDFRRLCGFPLRTESFAQPWVHPEKVVPEHQLSLRFMLESCCEIEGTKLALENAEQTTICVNGEVIPSAVIGYLADPSIQKVALPRLKAGRNELVLTMPYYNKFNVEYMYLLGAFDVQTAGRRCILREETAQLSFGDICGQGMPFYGANLTYRMPIEVPADGTLTVVTTSFRCPLIGVCLDGKRVGEIMYAPYQLKIPHVQTGSHTLELIAFGNRQNTFGGLHNTAYATDLWVGPDFWRSTGASWSYEYQLRPTGILISPVVTLTEE